MLFTKYLKNKILNHILGISAFTMPSSIYIGLFNVSPDNTYSGIEVAASGYSRVSASFSTSTNNRAVISSDVTITAGSTRFGTIEAIGIFDASTGGNLLCYFPLVGTGTKVEAYEELTITTNEMVIFLT